VHKNKRHHVAPHIALKLEASSSSSKPSPLLTSSSSVAAIKLEGNTNHNDDITVKTESKLDRKGQFSIGVVTEDDDDEYIPFAPPDQLP
jgi:hypothetical protein